MKVEHCIYNKSINKILNLYEKCHAWKMQFWLVFFFFFCGYYKAKCGSLHQLFGMLGQERQLGLHKFWVHLHYSVRVCLLCVCVCGGRWLHVYMMREYLRSAKMRKWMHLCPIPVHSLPVVCCAPCAPPFSHSGSTHHASCLKPYFFYLIFLGKMKRASTSPLTKAVYFRSFCSRGCWEALVLGSFAWVS